MRNKKSPHSYDDETQQTELEQILAAIQRDQAAAAEATQFTADDQFVTKRLRAEFVAQVRTVLKQKNLNPAALARLTHLSPARVSKILHEKGNITLGVIAKIAVALETKVSLNFGETVPVSPQPQQSAAIHHHLLAIHSNPPADVWRKPQQLTTSISRNEAAFTTNRFTKSIFALGS